MLDVRELPEGEDDVVAEEVDMPVGPWFIMFRTQSVLGLGGIIRVGLLGFISGTLIDVGVPAPSLLLFTLEAKGEGDEAIGICFPG